MDGVPFEHVAVTTACGHPLHDVQPERVSGWRRDQRVDDVVTPPQHAADAMQLSPHHDARSLDQWVQWPQDLAVHVGIHPAEAMEIGQPHHVPAENRWLDVVKVADEFGVMFGQ